MFGHWVGSCAEVAVKINVCSHMPTKYKDLCNGSTVFIHELLVEPLFNALFFRFVSHVIHHNHEKDVANPLLSLFAGAVTSLYLSKVTELIPTDYKPQFLDDNEAWISALVSLPGNALGEFAYESIVRANFVLANTMFASLFSYKVYSDLYVNNEHNSTAEEVITSQHFVQTHHVSDYIE
jgi:hypothetical protein